MATRSRIDVIARQALGESARVLRYEPLPVGQDSQPHKVWIEGHEHPYVIRWRKPRMSDRSYDREVEILHRLAQSTGIGVPTIYCHGGGQPDEPPFVMMDFVEGTPAETLLASPDARDEAQEQIGGFVAQVHEDRRAADDEAADVRLLDVRYGFLQAAVEARHVDLDIGLLEDCRQRVLSEPHLRASEQVFCLNDTELIFTRTEGRWRLSSILDPEWAHYSTRQQDIWQRMMRHPWTWERPQKVDFISPQEAAETPFFRGYAQRGKIDFERLRWVAPLYRLGLWGTAMDNMKDEPERARQNGALHGAEIRALARMIASR